MTNWSPPAEWSRIASGTCVPVTGVFKRRSEDLVRIRTGQGEIVATADHQFWIASRSRWCAATTIAAGTKLLSAEGHAVPVLSVSTDTLEGRDVWNIEVAGTSAFHVGKDSILVHNSYARTPRAARREAMRRAGIPTSQQPTWQRSHRGNGYTKPGRELVYDTPDGPKHVQHQLMDRDHGPHWEAGSPKPGGQRDSVGRRRLQNSKAKVEEGG